MVKAPWKIPASANVSVQEKNGYSQVKFKWEEKGWHYTARWHERVPGATLVKWPSWQLERVYPGKGFGKDAHQRLEEVRAGDSWQPVSSLSKAAWRLSHGQGSSGDQKLILATHFR